MNDIFVADVSRGSNHLRGIHKEVLTSLRKSFSINKPVTVVRFGEWEPICIYDYNPLLIFEFQHNSHDCNTLRFNPVQIGEWLDDLLVRNVVWTHAALAQYVGMSRTRVGQFLALAKLPAGARAKLKGIPDLNEYQTRGMMAVGGR